MDLGKADKMKMTYEQAVSYLYEIPKFTKKNGLEHTKELLRRLDIREENFKIIHVAGSNGKGSVCRAISEVLTENQKSNGLFISPHLVRMEERFCINGKMCSVEEFLEAFHCVYEVVERMQKEGLAHPTFFEYLFGMGNVDLSKKTGGISGARDRTRRQARLHQRFYASTVNDHYLDQFRAYRVSGRYD